MTTGSDSWCSLYQNSLAYSSSSIAHISLVLYSFIVSKILLIQISFWKQDNMWPEVNITEIFDVNLDICSGVFFLLLRLTYFKTEKQINVIQVLIKERKVKNFNFFDLFLWWPEVTVEALNPNRLVYFSRTITHRLMP